MAFSKHSELLAWMSDASSHRWLGRGAAIILQGAWQSLGYGSPVTSRHEICMQAKKVAVVEEEGIAYITEC